MTTDIETVDAHLLAATRPLATTPTSTDRELQLRNAAEFGDVAAIDTLIDAGVDPNVRIPEQSDHRFRSKVISHSGGK